MKPLTEPQVRARIRAYIDRHHGGNQASAARAIGMDEGQFSRIVNGKIMPTQAVLDMVDIRRSKVVKYQYEEVR